MRIGRNVTLSTREISDIPQKWATLLYRGAWYASESGNALDMREIALKSREQRMQLFGEQDEECLESSAMLATVYRLEGQWGKAENLEVQVMETRKNKVDDDHPDTLTSMANLAFIWKSLARNMEALELLRKCLSKQVQVIGAHHPNTLSNNDTLQKWEMETFNSSV